MRQRIIYAKLEKVIYEFDEFDIKNALLKLSGLPDYKEGRTVDFEWESDDDTGKLSASLVIKYTTEEKEE